MNFKTVALLEKNYGRRKYPKGPLLAQVASLLTKDSAAYVDDSLLNKEDEFPSVQIYKQTPYRFLQETLRAR